MDKKLEKKILEEIVLLKGRVEELETDFVKSIEKALRQIKEGKGLTKEQVFGKRKYDVELGNKVARDLINDSLIRVLKKEYPLVFDTLRDEEIDKLERENTELRETVEILQDKKIMRRFKQKSSGKNIPLKEMKKRLKDK